MSLAELTRNSFQSGIAARKWLSLSKLLIPKLPNIHGSDAIATSLTHSLLPLFRSYSGDPGLQEYLKVAIDDGILPLSTFIANLLEAARSPDLHVPATLDTLIRIALDAHYSSGKPPIGSVVSIGSSTSAILGTIKDATTLLRVAHSLPISPFHQLSESVSELLILLLSCVSDLSQIPTTDAMRYFTDVDELGNNYRVTPALRQVLDTYMVSLSLVLGDDAKAAREAQIVHSMQFAMSRGSIFGPNSEDDTITSGLLLNYIVTYRAHDFGAGDTSRAVALLVASFRSSSWTPNVFYTQLFFSAFSCLTQATTYTKLWGAFIAGRLPALLMTFGEIISSDTTNKFDMQEAAAAGLTAAFRLSDIIAQAENTWARELPTEGMVEDESPRYFARELLHQLVKANFINMQTASQLDSLVSNEVGPKWHTEALDAGMDLATYLSSKLGQDNGSIDSQTWLERVWKDMSSHAIFSNIVQKRFSSSVSTLDVDSMGHWCKLLYTNEHILDMVALHVRISNLIFHALEFLDKYDCETVGDPQTAVSHIGDVFLFVQYCLMKFKLPSTSFSKDGKTLSAEYLVSNTGERPLDEGTASQVWSSWYKALFDANSEGIEDNILRITKPKHLLRFAPTLVLHAAGASSVHKLDKEVLMNGIQYFTSPLLSWTLVAVIKALVREILHRWGGTAFTSCYEVIQACVLSPSCPKTVLYLCTPHILTLLEARPPPVPVPVRPFPTGPIREAFVNLGTIKPEIDPKTKSAIKQQPQPPILHPVNQMLNATFSMARSHKAPYLDIKRCLITTPPIQFLHLLWSEIQSAANAGEVEACRRIATFILTAPLDGTNAHPLLPIFIHVMLPSLIASGDSKTKNAPEQTMYIDLLTTIISSVLNAALNFELAMRSVSLGDDRMLMMILGQASSAMARRLALDLRRNRKSEVSGMILQRLAASPSFVANFPVFMTSE